MSYQHILLARSESIGVLTLNRPDKLNAFAGTMRHELADALEELENDPAVKVVVITGAGRGFCAGQDTCCSEMSW